MHPSWTLHGHVRSHSAQGAIQRAKLTHSIQPHPHPQASPGHAQSCSTWEAAAKTPSESARQQIARTAPRARLPDQSSARGSGRLICAGRPKVERALSCPQPRHRGSCVVHCPARSHPYWASARCCPRLAGLRACARHGLRPWLLPRQLWPLNTALCQCQYPAFMCHIKTLAEPQWHAKE